MPTARILPLHLLPAIETLQTESFRTRSAVCRAATLACALSDAPGALPPVGVSAGSSTTASFDIAGSTLFDHVRRTRKYRNLTVLMAQVAYSPELRQMTLDLLAMPPDQMTTLLHDTLRALGLPVPQATERKKKSRPPNITVKRLRGAELLLLRLLSVHESILPADTRALLERDKEAVTQRIAALMLLTK